MKKLHENEYVEGMTDVCLIRDKKLDEKEHPLLRALDYSKKGISLDSSWGIPKLKGLNLVELSEKVVKNPLKWLLMMLDKLGVGVSSSKRKIISTQVDWMSFRGYSYITFIVF